MQATGTAGGYDYGIMKTIGTEVNEMGFILHAAGGVLIGFVTENSPVIALIGLSRAPA